MREGYFASASSTQLMKWAIWIRDGAQKRQNRMALRGPRCADIDVVDLRSARRLNQHLAPSSAAFAIADRIISTGNRPRLWLPRIILSNTDAFQRSTVALCWHPLKREPCTKQGLFRLQHLTINTHPSAHPMLIMVGLEHTSFLVGHFQSHGSGTPGHRMSSEGRSHSDSW